MSKRTHRGSDFRDFLREEGVLEEVEARAVKRALALKLAQMAQEQDGSGLKAPPPLDSAGLPPNTFAMTVDLARDVEDFVREQMAAGTCAEPAQLVNDVLRSVRDQQRQPFPVSPELEAWLLESADQPTTPLTDADFQAIRTRARDRRPATA